MVGLGALGVVVTRGRGAVSVAPLGYARTGAEVAIRHDDQLTYASARSMRRTPSATGTAWDRRGIAFGRVSTGGTT
jgi:hypothetical protein